MSLVSIFIGWPNGNQVYDASTQCRIRQPSIQYVNLNIALPRIQSDMSLQRLTVRCNGCGHRDVYRWVGCGWLWLRDLLRLHGYLCYGAITLQSSSTADQAIEAIERALPTHGTILAKLTSVRREEAVDVYNYYCTVHKGRTYIDNPNIVYNFTDNYAEAWPYRALAGKPDNNYYCKKLAFF